MPNSPLSETNLVCNGIDQVIENINIIGVELQVPRSFFTAQPCLLHADLIFSIQVNIFNE